MLKSNPVKVRFAEEVIINGQVPVSSTAHARKHTQTQTQAYKGLFDPYKHCQMVITYHVIYSSE